MFDRYVHRADDGNVIKAIPSPASTTQGPWRLHMPPTPTTHCLLCGTPLPPDTRGWLRRLLYPRFPRCEPSEDCYRGLARRIGANPTDEEVARAVRNPRGHA